MIHIEASVHPITQDCSSNKTEKKPNTLRSEEALTWRKQRPVLPPPLTNGAPPRRPRTKYCGFFANCDVSFYIIIIYYAYTS
ncbi:hypothetical protein ACB092_02G006800 [Castanea dentata]